MLHAAETWAMTAATLNRLRRNDRAMIHRICNVKAKDEVSSDSLLSKLGTQDLEMVLITDRSKAVVLMWSLLAVLVSEFR